MTDKKNKKTTAEKAFVKKKNAPKKKTAEKKTVDKKTVEKKKNKELDQLKEQISLEKDRVLRLSAEFENYKKRKQRELDDFKRFANETIFKQLLTVVDNLERAIDSTKEDLNEDVLLKGVELTHKEIIKLFETFNVKPVKAENQIFDPNFHQAVTQEETDKIPDNTITKVLQKGYLLHDRLIRPAMVIVSKNKKKNNKNILED